jgi:glycerol-3-phosphate O-acyltransferase 1/2/ectonucleotide pyrophosphatase/phosphodiesterase family protein 5
MRAGDLLAGLEQRGMLDNATIIFTADHGMTELSTQRMIYLDDYINMSDVSVVTYFPVLNLRPKDGREAAVFNALNGAHPNMRCVLSAWDFFLHLSFLYLILVW